MAAEYCLVNDLDNAMNMARAFARGHCEPGPYYVIEVLKQRISITTKTPRRVNLQESKMQTAAAAGRGGRIIRTEGRVKPGAGGGDNKAIGLWVWAANRSKSGGDSG